MQEITSYDPYTIKDIEFFIDKKKKYATLKSIIISLAIFSLTIFMSYGSLKGIWAPKSELDIESSYQKTTSYPLTSNYLCVISKRISTKASNSTLVLIDAKNNSIISTFLPTNSYDDND